MAFRQATAPAGPRIKELLSADNPIPERHIVIETIRNAAPRLGLSASVIATLDAMLSCLAPSRNHHTVFASNATLTFRRNGISDRTIRRHAAVLQEVGLLVRNDSPNGKRFTKQDRAAGKALRFGFDLSPLFHRLNEIAGLAAKALQEREQIDYLRTKIRATANKILINEPENEIALSVFRILRRKLTLRDCQQLLTTLPPSQSVTETESESDITTAETEVLTANDGQTVRHHHNSNKELIDKPGKQQKKGNEERQHQTPITVPEILEACPEAAQYSLDDIKTEHDVVGHARTLAPMIGITGGCYEAALLKLGPLRTAATVWGIMQMQDKIKSVGAYFRAITTGRRSANFDPERLIRQLLSKQCAVY